MAYDTYNLLNVSRSGALVTAVVDAPPINVITLALFVELAALAEEIEAYPSVLVFVLKSADPDFFLAHFDVEALIAMADAPAAEAGEVSAYHEMCARYQRMDKVTIAQIEGRVGGGGAELSMSFDMRFGVIGKTVINQMEVPIGILPGGTGTQRLPRLVGRARAIEVILGGGDLDAETAERCSIRNRPAINSLSIWPRPKAAALLQLGKPTRHSMTVPTTSQLASSGLKATGPRRLHRTEVISLGHFQSLKG